MPDLFHVRLCVRFGPAQQRTRTTTLLVEKGTTPKEALSQVCSIRSGKSCCSPREVFEVNGIATNGSRNRWWKCTVNGKGKTVSPYRTRLKPGDLVEWT